MGEIQNCEGRQNEEATVKYDAKSWGVCQLSGGMGYANCRKLHFNCAIKIQPSIIRQ